MRSSSGHPAFPLIAVHGAPEAARSHFAAAAQALGGALITETDEPHQTATPDLSILPADPSVIRALRETGADRAVIAVIDPAVDDARSAGLAASAIDAGADDTVDLGCLNERVAAEAIEKALAIAGRRRRRDAELESARRVARDADQHAAKLTERIALLESQAWTDPLTGLANRRQLFARLDRMFAEAIRYSADLSCAMLDLDGFKSLNDKLGHREGDACLRRAARAVSDSVRASDVAARYGGDEFIILMPRTQINEAARVARRAADSFSDAVQHWADRCECLGLSVGVSSVEATKPLDAEGLIDAADRAMYAAKADSGCRVMLCAGDGSLIAGEHA